MKSKTSKKEILSGIRDQIYIVHPEFVEMTVQTDESELQDIATLKDCTVVTVLTVEVYTQTDTVNSLSALAH